MCNRLAPESLDGVVSIFYVLNCLDSAADMLAHLRLMHARMKPGARLLLDVWNGAAVFAHDPESSVRHYPLDGSRDREVVKLTVPKLNRLRQECTLRYQILSLDRTGSGHMREFHSTHVLRFLTPLQYRHMLQIAGLDLLDEFVKGQPGVPISEKDWYISYVASGTTDAFTPQAWGASCHRAVLSPLRAGEDPGRQASAQRPGSLIYSLRSANQRARPSTAARPTARGRSEQHGHPSWEALCAA